LDEVDAFERLSTEGHDLEEMYEEIQQAFDLTGKDMGNRKRRGSALIRWPAKVRVSAEMGSRPIPG
jgi:hypothetical protein